MGVAKRKRNRLIAINACETVASIYGSRLVVELSARQQLRELVKSSLLRVLQRRDTSIRFKPTPPLSEVCKYVNGVIGKGSVIYLGNKLKVVTSSPLLGSKVSFSDDRTKIGRVFDTDILRAYPHTALGTDPVPDNLRQIIESFKVRKPEPPLGQVDYAVDVYKRENLFWERLDGLK